MLINADLEAPTTVTADEETLPLFASRAKKWELNADTATGDANTAEDVARGLSLVTCNPHAGRLTLSRYGTFSSLAAGIRSPRLIYGTPLPPTRKRYHCL